MALLEELVDLAKKVHVVHQVQKDPMLDKANVADPVNLALTPTRKLI